MSLRDLLQRPSRAAAPGPEPTPDASSLESILSELERYGLPNVSRQDSGWCARLKIHTALPGQDFDVWSEFGHATPLAAALQVRERLRNTLSSLSGLLAGSGANP